MIPFDSFDGTNSLYGTDEQTKLEQYIGPTAVAFASYQSAVGSILEILGSRTVDTPVIMSIAASPVILAAVLRAGATPFLLDIDPGTLQIDPEAVQEIIDEVKTPVFIFDRPGGQPVDPRLLELAADFVTIVATKLVPRVDSESDCVGSFTVFTLQSVVGSGAIVQHKYQEQVKELKQVRSGILGMSENLNETLAALALKRLKSVDNRPTQKLAAEAYLSELLERRPLPFVEGSEWPYFVVAVENAQRVVAYLHTDGVAAVQPVYPMHMYPSIAKRWTQTPSYPNAEAVCNKLVALPTHLGVRGKEEAIVKWLLEVSDD